MKGPEWTEDLGVDSYCIYLGIHSGNIKSGNRIRFLLPTREKTSRSDHCRSLYRREAAQVSIFSIMVRFLTSGVVEHSCELRTLFSSICGSTMVLEDKFICGPCPHYDA